MKKILSSIRSSLGFGKALALVIVLAASAIFVLLILTKKTQDVQATPSPALQVVVQKAQFKKYAPEIILYGRIESPYTSHLRAGITAYVKQLKVHEGSRFKKGEVLLELDERDVAFVSEQRAAQVDNIKHLILEEKQQNKSDKAVLKEQTDLVALAEKNLSREKALLERKLVSAQRVDALMEFVRRAKVTLIDREHRVTSHGLRIKQLSARLKEAKAALKIAQLDVERTKIKAPFDGRVSKLHVSPGERVQQDSSLVDVYAAKKLEVRAQIPQDKLSFFRKAIEHKEKINATTRIPPKTHALYLDRLAGEVQGGAGGQDGLFKFKKSDPFLAIGQTLTITALLPAIDGVIAVPERALYQFDRIYIVKNERLHAVKVTILGYKAIHGKTHVLIKSEEIAPHDYITLTHLPNAITGLSVKVVNILP